MLPAHAIRFRVKIPDYESQGTAMEYGWSQGVYGNVQEDLPFDMPTRKDKRRRITTYNIANSMSVIITGRSMSGVLHFINQTEQIMDLWHTLRVLRIPVDGPVWLFGDNQSTLAPLSLRHSSIIKVIMLYPTLVQIMFFMHVKDKYKHVYESP